MTSGEYQSTREWIEHAVLTNGVRLHPAFLKPRIALLAKRLGIEAPASHQLLWQGLSEAAHDHDRLTKIRPFHESAASFRELTNKIEQASAQLIAPLSQEAIGEWEAVLNGAVTQAAFYEIANLDDGHTATPAASQYYASQSPLKDLTERLLLLNRAAATATIPSPDGKPIENYPMAVFIRRACNLCENGLGLKVTVDPNVPVIKSATGKFILECAFRMGDASETYVISRIRKFRTDTKARQNP